LLSIRDYLNQI